MKNLARICGRSAMRLAFISPFGRRTRERVSVVGDFNDWDGRVNPMRKLLSAGVWELFCPGIKQGRTTSLKSAPRPARCC